MSWTGDSSGLLLVEGDKVTLQGKTKGDTKANGIWTGESRCWRWSVHQGKGMWLGVGTEDKFGPGYSLKGLMYGGPGNLSDGGSLVTGGWGPKIQQGDLVDMRLTLEEDRIKLEFGHNNSYLGTAFDISGWTGGQLRPVVSLSSSGDSVSIKNITDEEFPKEMIAKNSENVEGIWSNTTEIYSLSLSAVENSSTNFRLSVCVVFGNTMSGSVEVQDDGSWKVSGPMMTTQMMPPSDIYEVEKRVFKQFERLSNIKRDGDDLVVTFGSGEQLKFDPQGRPGPASKEKIHWMR